MFRHTHATLLSDLGEPLKTSQAILGHSDMQTTLQVYTHAVTESVIRAEERLAELVLDPNGPQFTLAGKRKTRKSRGFNKKVARLGRLERPTSGSGEHPTFLTRYENS